MVFTGVTGGRAENQARVEGLIGLLREVTDNTKSVAVGFGVSGPKQVRIAATEMCKRRCCREVQLMS